MMINILIVDSDSTCLVSLKEWLEKWNYQVTTATHAYKALSMLVEGHSYDLVLAEVHIPDMDGIELLHRINQKWNIPVLLMSADKSDEVICKGVGSGAQCFFVKPLVAEDLQYIWQYSKWWKDHKKNSPAPDRQIVGASESVRITGHHDGHNTNASAAGNTSRDHTIGRRHNNMKWTPQLHSRFVEAILMLGYQRAVPKTILQIMEVDGLTRAQVGSHMQKYEHFLQGVLEGSAKVEDCSWIDLNYISSSVGGNPDLVLIDHLREELRKGKLAANKPLQPSMQHNIDNANVQAPTEPSSSGQYRPLPPSTGAQAASINRGENATLMPNNNAHSSANVALRGLGSATSWNDYNVNIGTIVGGSTSNSIHNLSNTINQTGCYNQNILVQEQNNNSGNGDMRTIVGGSTSNSIRNLSYMTNQTGCYNQNIPVQEQNIPVQENNNSGNGGLISTGANSNMFSAPINVALSSITAPLFENLHPQQYTNVGGQDGNNFHRGNNFEMNQLGTNNEDPNTDISLNEDYFGNTSAMNADISAAEDGKDWSDSDIDFDEVFAKLDADQENNPGPGEDGKYWLDIDFDEDADNKENNPGKELPEEGLTHALDKGKGILVENNKR